MMPKTRIAIYQKDLKLGGIQKSLIALLNSIDTSCYEIDLYLFSKDNFYMAEFPSGVNIIYKNAQSKIARYIPFGIYHLFKKVEIDNSYDIAIDFNGYQNITATHAIKTKAKKRMYWVHSDLYARYTAYNSPIIRFIYKMLNHLTQSKWRHFDTFVGVSDGVLEGFRKSFEAKNFVTIPNLINTNEVLSKSDAVDNDTTPFVDTRKVNIAFAGRVVHAKGLDLLMPKFAKVIENRQDIHFYIIGDGPKKKSLEKQVKRLQLVDYVTFLEAQKNPSKFLAKMDGLVLHSRYEGQGMVLMEGKALGIPLFFPKHLEKYNSGLEGVDDIVEALSSASKLQTRKIDRLESYNANIIDSIDKLFSSPGDL